MILEMCKAVCKLLYTRRCPPFEVRQELVQQQPRKKCNSELWVLSRAVHCTVEERGSDMKRPNRISSQQGVGVMTALCSLFQPSPHSHPGDEMDDNTTQSWHFKTFKIVCLAVVNIFPICTNLVRGYQSCALYSSHRHILVMVRMALARGKIQLQVDISQNLLDVKIIPGSIYFQWVFNHTQWTMRIRLEIC